MTTIAKTFSAVGQTSTPLTLTAQPAGAPLPLAFSYTLTGTFVATLVLEYSLDSVNWVTAATYTATQTALTIYGPAFGQPPVSWRFRCTDYTSGSPVSTMTTATNVLSQVVNTAGTVIFQVTEAGIIVAGQSPSLSGTAALATAQRGIDVAATAAAAALSFGSSLTTGLQIMEQEEVVSLASAGAKYVSLTNAIPAGAVILSAQMNIDTLVVAGGTSVKVGLGDHAGTCNTYGNTADLLKNTKSNLLPAYSVLSADTTLDVCACATVASGLGNTNFSAGAVRVRIVYLKAASLPDA